MTVKISSSNRGVTEKDISNFEDTSGMSLPVDYKEFLKSHNGSVPETNVFSIDAKNESGITEFIPLGSLVHEKRLIRGKWSSKLLPIAWAEGGNYVCLDLAQRTQVIFWDHELPDTLAVLAENFTAFLKLLQPFDVSKVEIRPGQLKSAWIDPEFLKEIDKTDT